MTLDPNKMKRYEREGYPKFIRGHEHKGHSPWNKDKSWDKETLDKITKINRERTQDPNYIHPMLGKKHTSKAKELNRQKHLGNKNAEGHIVTEEQKENQRQKMLGRTSPMKGVTRKPESNLLQSIAMKEKDPWNKGLVGVQESPMKDKHHNKETCKKLRKARIKQIEQNYGIAKPSYNLSASEYFKSFDLQHNTHGRYAVYGNGEYLIPELGYFPDYINFDLKLIMEFDEEHHFDENGNILEKDIQRQKEIQEFYPDFEFRRIREKDLNIINTN